MFFFFLRKSQLKFTGNKTAAESRKQLEKNTPDFVVVPGGVFALSFVFISLFFSCSLRTDAGSFFLFTSRNCYSGTFLLNPTPSPSFLPPPPSPLPPPPRQKRTGNNKKKRKRKKETLLDESSRIHSCYIIFKS